jgi:hypothetical protein
VPATPGTFAWPAQPPLAPHLAGHARDLGGEGVELVDHRVDHVLDLQHLAARVDGDLARQVAARDRGGHVGDVAHLAGEVAGHGVHVLGEVGPRAGDAGHASLPAQHALGAHLLGHARHLAGEHAELVDHRVDGVLELEHLAAHVGGHLLTQVAVGHGGDDERRVAHLPGEVAGERVHVVGEVLPRARHARHVRLPAEHALGAHLARHARHLAGEARELVHHRVDGVLQLEHLALRRPR